MKDILTINHIEYFLIPLLLFFIGIVIGRFIQKLADLSFIKKQKQIAVKKSRAIIGGQVAEQVAPFLPNFPCKVGDVSFIGKPVDFIAFSGLSEKNKIEEVVFIEVKTGQSKLNEHEKQLKEAIQKGRVRYVEYYPEI